MSADTAKVDKVIVTNLAALKAKYGLAGSQKVQAAVQELITSDQRRGLVTRFYLVDDAKSMKQVNAPQVTKATDPKQNKDAIDALCRALAPDYLMILGAIDVVPHQDLENPIYSPDDPDRFAFGDLPYACEARYSRRPQDFFGPTRVVGRLPDMTGARDPLYLINLVNFAAKYKNSDASSYRSYFGISAEIWKDSSVLSVTSTFGDGADLKTVPPSKDKWPPPFLGRLAHFINCHGAPHDSRFFGQPASGAQDYPVALDAGYLNLKVTEGTVIAAECCYGAQLFDPALNQGQSGISNTYLANKSYGFFGSTTIAYGPADGNDSADLICQYFLQSVLRGASLGRAALEARQEFVHRASMSEPDNVKTIAQFNLYADPSLTPIKPPHVIAALSKGISVQAAGDLRVARAERRRDLFGRGIALAKSQPVIAKFTGKVTDPVLSVLGKKAAEYGIALGRTLTFDVKKPSVSKWMPLGLVTKEVFPNRVYVIFQSGPATQGKTVSKRKVAKAESSNGPAVTQIVALIVKEANGTIVSAKKIFSK
ncbi:MAG: hypothetical protein ABSH16_11490 [Sedimentisphaerales bacterium]|jgi:hypothetical protein